MLALAALAFTVQPELGPEPETPSGELDDAADEAQRLFSEADARYQTSDYRGAVEAFTRAYAVSQAIEDEPLRDRVQAAIMFNLGRAHLKAYSVDEEPEHLRQAIELFEKYLAQSAELEDQRETERELREARALLEAYEHPQMDDGEPEPPPTGEPPATGEPPPTGEARRNRVALAGYVTLVGVGVGIGVSGGGAAIAARAQRDYDAGPTRAERDDAITRGRVGNVLIIAGGAFAGAMVVTGIALIATGKSKQRRDLALVPAPLLGSGRLGLALGGSF